MFLKVEVLFATLCLGISFGNVGCQEKSEQAPHCFDTTACPCCKVGVCPSDGSGQCKGQCADGFHGGKCRNICPDNCVICVDARGIAGVSNCTHCKLGYYSDSIKYQCQQSCPSGCKRCYSATHCSSCKDGYDLTDSNLCIKCPDICSHCTSETFCTFCKDGYYLQKSTGSCHECGQLCSACTSRDVCICSNGCYRTTDNWCDTDRRACLYGCKANITSVVVSTDYCDTCVNGTYGNDCNNSCNGHCEPRICERNTGTCQMCKAGFYGDSCGQPCPRNCLSICNKSTGDCYACRDAYYGARCNATCVANCQICDIKDGQCSKCTDGLYGATCDKNCSQNCQPKRCEKSTGNCYDCIGGYAGDKCQIEVTSTRKTTEGLIRVVTDSQRINTGAAVGGTLGGVVVAGVLLFLVVFLYRRRFTHKYVRYDIQFDCYKLDPSLTDILEENDEFDPTYFTGTVDDTKKPCGKLPVRELAKFVDSKGEDFYQEEFLRLPRGLIKPCDDAKRDENIVKNRYTGIYPYDEHRVKLLPPGSDFINACYMDGFKRKKEYIASLGPTVKAMEHFRLFWRMVWQEKTDVIVMVTNLMEGQSMKCEQYWPDIATSSTYDDITVTSLKENFYAEFVVRTLSLTRDEEQRELHHVHFTAWPDKRVPDELTSLIELRQKVKAIKPVLGGPTIVHCSAGIGRTGTYIALDILIHQGKAQKALDIFDWVTRMREQRTSMVQTWPQYEYLHHALVHALTYHCEPIKAKKFQHFMDKADNKRMTGLFKQLNERSERMSESEREAREMNRGLEGMDRDGADIPGSQHRPFLHLDKKYGESNYINAVYLNSFTVKNRFLIAQTPLPETVKDFLTLITQVTCSCIVSMDPPGLRDQTIGEYYPITPGDVFTHPSYVFEVEAQELDTNPSYSLRRLTVHFNKRSGSTSRTVYHFQCQHWPQGNQVPNVRLFLQLVQDVEAMADRDMDRGPVLVHCLNAAGRSGLFCAVSNLIQKMRLEGEVSVVNTLRQVNFRRPLAIPNKDQYVFCYQSVLQFVKAEAENNDENVYGNVE